MYILYIGYLYHKVIDILYSLISYIKGFWLINNLDKFCLIFLNS